MTLHLKVGSPCTASSVSAAGRMYSKACGSAAGLVMGWAVTMVGSKDGLQPLVSKRWNLMHSLFCGSAARLVMCWAVPTTESEVGLQLSPMSRWSGRNGSSCTVVLGRSDIRACCVERPTSADCPPCCLACMSMQPPHDVSRHSPSALPARILAIWPSSLSPPAHMKHGTLFLTRLPAGGPANCLP